MVYHVYTLRCADKSLYIGSAENLEARLKAHNEGQSAAYTFKQRPVRIVHSESYFAEHEALARERSSSAGVAQRKKR